MTHAEICPVCKGSGMLVNDDDFTTLYKVLCHGCSGRGWVEVSDVYDRYVFPYVPQPWYIQDYKITCRMNEE